MMMGLLIKIVKTRKKMISPVASAILYFCVIIVEECVKIVDLIKLKFCKACLCDFFLSRDAKARVERLAAARRYAWACGGVSRA